MKECYQEAQMEVVYFELVDLITTSSGPATTAEWVPSADCESSPDPDAFANLY